MDVGRDREGRVREESRHNWEEYTLHIDREGERLGKWRGEGWSQVCAAAYSVVLGFKLSPVSNTRRVN